MTPDAYCQQKAAQSGSSFYYSFRFLPPEQRRAITALYAFCREVDDAVDEVPDPGVARLKLAWWRNQVAAMFGGTPQEVIDGMAMDLDQNRYLDFASLERYCHRVAGVVGLMATEIFGATQEATRAYAHNLGIAFQLTNIIRDVGEDAQRGRIYLPQDELAQFGVGASDLFQRRVTPAFQALMAHQAARARAFYARAMAALPPEDRRAQRPGLIMAAIYRKLLDEIERDGFHVLDQRIALPPLRKAWIAWKTSWSY